MWTLTGIELFKIFKKLRTYIAFAAIGVIIVLIQLAMYADGEEYLKFMLGNIETAFDIEGKKLNGYFIFLSHPAYPARTCTLIDLPGRG